MLMGYRYYLSYFDGVTAAPCRVCVAFGLYQQHRGGVSPTVGAVIEHETGVVDSALASFSGHAHRQANSN